MTEEREISLWALEKKTQLREGGLGERLFILIERFLQEYFIQNKIYIFKADKPINNFY